MGKINQSTAIANAEKAAQIWYHNNQVKIDNGTYDKVVNTGDDDDWVDASAQETIRNTWLHKGAWHGLDRRASLSSGEAKFDLKFAIHDKTNSCFNYHVPFKVDNTAELLRKAESIKMKKVAEEFKEKQEKEALELKERQEQEKKVQLKKQQLLKTLTPLANQAWNKLSDKAQKGLTETTWKKDWIETRLKQQK